MNTLTTIDELAFAPPLQQEVEDTTSDHALLEATGREIRTRLQNW